MVLVHDFIFSLALAYPAYPTDLYINQLLQLTSANIFKLFSVRHKLTIWKGSVRRTKMAADGETQREQK